MEGRWRRVLPTLFMLGLLFLALAHKGDWRRAFREWPRNPDFYACRERPLSERFPWDHFDVGTKRERLETEYQRAMGLVPERTIQWKAALAGRTR